MDKNGRFKHIHHEYAAKVLRLCKGYFYGDMDKARDAAQDVFVNVWQYLDTFRNESAVGTWIYRITVNVCLSHVKKLSAKKEIITLAVPEKADETDNIQEEQLKQMYACIQQLDEHNKTIILLVLEDVEYREIASVMGISEETLRVKIHRIKKTLTKYVRHGNI